MDESLIEKQNGNFANTVLCVVRLISRKLDMETETFFIKTF